MVSIEPEASNKDVTRKIGVSSNGLDGERVPRHIAIIMDGNARWAKKHGLTVAQGHRAGYNNIERVSRILGNHGVKEVTLFAFSTENWQRPDDEVHALMDLAAEAIEQGVQRFHENGVRLRHVGHGRRLPSEMLRKIADAERLTRENEAIGLNLAFDYGGREEIVNAIRSIVRDGVNQNDIDDALFERYLFTAGIPDPDMVIRTGGEFRISNFMIWQSAYSEFFSSPALWPEFGESEINAAIEAYSHRQRRFGQRPA